MKYFLIAILILSKAQAQDTIIVYYKGDYKVPPAGTFWLSGEPDTRPTFKPGPSKDCECETGRVKSGIYCDYCFGPCDNCRSCRCTRIGRKNCGLILVSGTIITGPSTFFRVTEISPPKNKQ